jgi:hypothetical protein
MVGWQCICSSKETDKAEYNKLCRVSYAIPAINQELASDPWRWWEWYDTMVGWQCICSSSQYEKSQQRSTSTWRRRTSTCQKLNTKISTEAELVAADNIMPQVLWTKNVLESQGYKVEKSSSGKRTCHINTWYYFVTDRVSRGEMHIECCLTKNCCRLLLLLSHIKVQLWTLTKRTSFDTWTNKNLV